MNRFASVVVTICVCTIIYYFLPMTASPTLLSVYSMNAPPQQSTETSDQVLTPTKYTEDAAFVAQHCNNKMDASRWIGGPSEKTVTFCTVPGDQITSERQFKRNRFQEIPQMDVLFKKVFPKYNDAALVDVGGNLGTYCIVAGLLGRRVFTFEPQALVHTPLMHSVALNNVKDLIDIYQVALLRDRGCLARGHFVRSNPASARWLLDPSCKAATGLKAVMLDDLLPVFIRENRKQAILKIDVESAEPKVILGGKRFLEAIDVVFIQIEWFILARDLKSPILLEMLEYLKSLGYIPRGYDSPDLSSPPLDWNDLANWGRDVYFTKQ